MTKTVIDCPHLPKVDAPVEWAVVADGVFYSSQIPIRADGTVETGSIEQQAVLTFNNLKLSIEAAGGSLQDMTQVQIYITRPEDFAMVNEVYQRFFTPPYPNRATVVAAGLLIPDMAIEIVATAHIGKQRG